MARLTYILFAVLLIAVVAFAKEQECSPWGGRCHTYSDCCRDTECAFYAAKCVPITGIRVPGKDTRPLGPGPYPPLMGK